MNYTIDDLCHPNLFIRGKFPIYSQSRYFKIFNMLFKFGYHLTLCMKREQFIPLTVELMNIRDLLYSYVNNVYKDGNIHYNTLIHYKNNNILKQKESILKDFILKSMLLLNKFIREHKYMKLTTESIDFFITKTITVYSLYLALKNV